ncbi:MAG: heavy metal translocating P-type ATPase [Candidatus Nomurabacteria bacterium]|jgi:heavy metal translocating P-type ATPase|nr:heavy metal translocating P-type ATPase [Candidatus Nomurabacteria bacterium]
MKKFCKVIKKYWEFSATIVLGAATLIAAFVCEQQIIANYIIGIWGAFISILMLVDMIKTLREGKYGVDILAITAIIATIAVGQLWATLVIIVMLTGGETLEDYANTRAERELKALLERAPRIAHLVLKSGEIQDVAIGKIKPDDVVLVRPQEVVPVDGELLDVEAEFDESSLTGESLPVLKSAGDGVMSGSLNGTTAIKIRATADAKHSQYEQIIALVRDAESQPAPFVRLADKYAVPFTLISYVIAGAAWATSGNPTRFAEVLVVASPCPLILAAPIALISGMSRASKHGIIVKNGAVLEKMNRVSVMAFDKTGTLTMGTVLVDQIVPAKGFMANEILKVTSAAEANSAHILAVSLVKYATDRKIKLPTAKNVREMTGDGVFATIDGQKVIVGRAEFLRKNKIDMSSSDSFRGSSDNKVDYPNKSGNDEVNDKTAIFVAIDHKFAGAIYFADQVRENAKKTIHELKRLGVKETVMLTGDKRDVANKIGSTAGVDKVFVELLPKDKVEIMRNLCGRKDSVAMVGDGVNDAPVLAAADVGIAMGARGSTAASESADAVIMLDDLSRVALLRKISKRTIKVALQSVWSGIALCLILELIAVTGFIPALVGAGLQELIDVTVIFNALRAHKG